MVALQLKHATILTPTSRLDDVSVLVREERIVRVGATNDAPPDSGLASYDLRGKYVVPGFIDLQLNGAFGDDFTAHPETIWRVAAQLPRFGITSFLPTLVTSPLERVDAARAALHSRPANFRGAEPLGLHLEGPFLNPQKKGAHNPAYLRSPDAKLIRDWSRENGVSLVTLAPELPGALELVQALAARGVLVSMGHTMATYAEACAGYTAGIRYATHLPNAMPALEHRAPNAAGAVLADPDWVAGVIADGVHLEPAFVKLIWLTRGAAGFNLVSDAMAALGMPPGEYQLNDFEVHVTTHAARLKNGTLAGSILPLDQAVRNLIAYTGCSLSQAIATVTTTPARLLGLSGERGEIVEGRFADLVVLDENLQVTMTIVRGKIFQL